MPKPKKTLLEEIGEELGKGVAEMRADFDEVREEAKKLGLEIQQSVWDTMSEAERAAAQAAIKAEDAWKKFNVDDRLYGGAGGAKLGALFGLAAGPKGAAVGGTLGFITGLIVGDKAVQRFRAWRDGHKPSNDDKPQP
ncbi:MAG: hypothetical protein AAF984_09370 [Verrucomicrobiota bacterium]